MYTIHITDKIGFTYYDIINISDVIDLGDTYNIITDIGDMWLDKDNCYIIYNNMGNIESLEYNTPQSNVLIHLTI